jgi:hypothetical protein
VPRRLIRARFDVDSQTNFDFAAQLPTSNRARGRFGFWALVSIAVVTGLIVGEVYPMHAFGPSSPNSAPIKVKTQRYFEAVQPSSSPPQKSTADPIGAKPAFAVQKPEGLAQPPTAVADAFVPLPPTRPKLQIVRYPRYFYVRTVDQGDADGLTFRIERRLCKSPNLPPICFEPLSVRQKTILNDF